MALQHPPVSSAAPATLLEEPTHTTSDTEHLLQLAELFTVAGEHGPYADNDPEGEEGFEGDTHGCSCSVRLLVQSLEASEQRCELAGWPYNAVEESCGFARQ
jgi:hypothetical protein